MARPTEDGQTVADGEIKAGHLFATIFKAIGIDIYKEYHLGARPDSDCGFRLRAG